MIIPILIYAAALQAPAAHFFVTPSATDPAINTFDSPHSVFTNAGAQHRNQLLIFLPGTNGKTMGSNLFCGTAANQGYDVINLMYPDSIPATAVAGDEDPNGMLNFRLEIIEGGDKSPAVEVDRANSIENRIQKALRYLATIQPKQNWNQYLDAKGDINWSKVVITGHSQGAGHAMLIAIRHQVTRAVLFGGPKDFDRVRNRPANWYTTPATPLDRIFTFNHEQDKQGCDIQEQFENCKTIGLYRFGGPVSVDKMSAPYAHSHILTTNYPGTKMASGPAHTSVQSDFTTPKGANGGALFQPVWVYMLTTPVQ